MDFQEASEDSCKLQATTYVDLDFKCEISVV